MSVRRLLPLLLVLLLLPGCFRQAGEVYEPNDSAAQTVPTGEGDTSSQEGDTPAPTSDSDLPPVTIISPPTAVPVGETPTEQAPAETPVDTSVEGQSPEVPSETPSEQPTISSEVEVVETPTQPVFLTPNVPLPVTDIPPTQPGAAPTHTPSGLITPTALPDGPTGDGCTYTVQGGNTLFSIARNNGITLDQLRAANPEVVGDLIQVGQVLNIPGCGQGVDEQGNPIQPPTATPVTGPSGETIHTVQAGDTLVRIARQYNVTVQAIVTANNLQNPNVLAVGQQLIIPTPEP